MQKICLVIPPSQFLLDERVFISLGVLKVAAALEAQGVIVEMLDLSGISNFQDVVADHLESSDVKFVGITATTSQLPTACKIVETIRRVRADARIILGGPHPTLQHAAMLNEQKRGVTSRATKEMQRLQDIFDVLVAGDGEKAIFEACAPNAPSIINADGKKQPLFLTEPELDASPLPARHLVDVGSYHYQIDGVPAMSLIAQLGCPFQCGFCAGRSSPMLRHIRTRSNENIVEEMLHLYHTYGIRGFMFYDDELNISKGVVDLMNRISGVQQKLGVEWRLRGFVKSERFTDEQAEAMYRAGFRWLLVGFESGSPRILENIKKMATREHNSRCMAIARRHGLKVKALMSVGHPGESHETIQETLDWLLEEKPNDFDVTIITPYPGSPYYDDAVPGADGVWTYTCKNGDRLHQANLDYTVVADYYKGDPNDGYVAHVHTDFLTSIELVSGRDRVEKVVRETLGIPYYPATAATQYEHSMGMTGIPANILRKSQESVPV